jgi:hypothetical protein
MTSGRVIDQFGNGIELAIVRDLAGNGTATDLYGNWSFFAVGDTIEADANGYYPQAVPKQSSHMTIVLYTDPSADPDTVTIVGTIVKKRDLTIVFFITLAVIGYFLWRMSK